MRCKAWSSLEKADETTRIDHASCWRGGYVAARGARAGARPAAVWLPQWWRGRSIYGISSWNPARPENGMGFVEGRDFAAEYRRADDHLDRLPALAVDLVQHRVAVIVTGGGPQPALAAKSATSTIPIVFFTGDDPVKFGLVPRDNRPGSNLTGFNFMISELGQKRVGLLHELVPTAGVVAALCDPHGSEAAAILAEVAAAAKFLGLELITVNASDPAQFGSAFAQAEHAGAGAMLVTAAELFTVSRANRDRLVELAAKHRLPAMFSLRETAETGGLISYSADPVDGYRQVGIYVGRILKGEIPVTCRSCSRPNSHSPSTSRPRRR